MVVRTGVDALEIRRVEEALRRYGDRFLRRVFTPEEVRRYHLRLPSLAARFAAKEAVSKALGCGIGPVGWLEIEVLHDSDQQPRLVLYGGALRRAQSLGLKEWSVSLTHTQELAIAVVVGWGE
ncbi:MAG: holo-ACP synthase [Anaerolineales bacterium]|nr:holo-ACP synthase [Anaerolineales bacterium]MCS7248648.1 holo-ACP synthase [Anaerolineales bacterium]MDW8162461.1 holo-ACP synthase [Anaerolineales bacterium]MDW8447896.1 holo-ACP synthase [Anaerolineales bacterium]